MKCGYLPVQGKRLEHIFGSGVIQPPLFHTLLQRHTEQEAKRLLHESREDAHNKIELLEQIALKQVLEQVEEFKQSNLAQEMKKEGVTTKTGIAFHLGTHSHDQKIKQLLSGIDLQQNYIMLYSTLKDANTQTHFPKHTAILQVKLPENSRLEKIAGIGAVYLVADEVPTCMIYRVHASDTPLARKILEENGSNAELTSFGAIATKE